MLDNLKGIQSARVVKPDRRSQGMQAMIEAEKILLEMPQSMTPKQRKEYYDKAYSVFDRCSGLSFLDLHDYITVKLRSHTEYEIGDMLIGSLTGKVLDLVSGKTAEPLYLNLNGHSFPYLFFNSKKPADIIIDNAIGSHLCSHMRFSDRTRKLVIANSKDTDLMEEPDIPKGVDMLLISNCKADSAGKKSDYSEKNLSTVQDIGHYIVVDSDTRSSFDGHSLERSFIWYVNISPGYLHLNHRDGPSCTTGYISGKYKLSRKGMNISEEQVQKIQAIGRSMKDKDGRVVAALGDEIVKILDGVELC